MSTISLDVRNLVKIRSQRASLRLREISRVSVCDFLYLSFPFLSFPFFFLVIAYSKNDWTDVNAWCLILRGFAQRSAFRGSLQWTIIFKGRNSLKTDLFGQWIGILSQICKIFEWRYLRNYLFDRYEIWQESPAVADKPARRLRKVRTVYVRAVGL